MLCGRPFFMLLTNFLLTVFEKYSKIMVFSEEIPTFYNIIKEYIVLNKNGIDRLHNRFVCFFVQPKQY